MYVAVLLILAGWSLSFGSWMLAAYAVAVMIAFHLRVVLYEEPWLAERHGGRWLRYRDRFLSSSAQNSPKFRRVLADHDRKGVNRVA